MVPAATNELPAASSGVSLELPEAAALALWPAPLLPKPLGAQVGEASSSLAGMVPSGMISAATQ